ncbi:unnamed protein product [Ectocarpus sp. 12 AP-2014]
MPSAGLEFEIGDCAMAAKATPGVDGMQVKEEEEEEQEQEEDHGERLQSRPGKRKRGGMAEALQRYSIWTAGSRQPNPLSPAGAPSKRQRKTSSPGAKHAKPGMIDLVSKRCGHLGCMKRPSHGKDGSKRPEFCAQHRQQGTVDIVTRRCDHPGCMK